MSALQLICRKPFVLAAGLLLCICGASLAYAAHPAPQPPTRLEATIFSYDGREFTRTKTTLMTEAGKSAANTTLEHDNPAYQALLQKKSYSGTATVFGKSYQANYAPMFGADGQLSGALFVAVPQ